VSLTLTLLVPPGTLKAVRPICARLPIRRPWRRSCTRAINQTTPVHPAGLGQWTITRANPRRTLMLRPAFGRR
jgi:hypothetical protein